MHEHMVHQCVSEDLWFRNMLGIDVAAPPLPREETRLEFMKRYAEDSGKRLHVLRAQREPWWEDDALFFDVRRSRAWIMTRRMTHTSHHRGQLMAMLRMLGRDVHSNYGPTADTGGLMQNQAPTIYAYQSIDALLNGEAEGGAKAALPGALGKRVTERPVSADGTSREESQDTWPSASRFHVPTTAVAAPFVDPLTDNFAIGTRTPASCPASPGCPSCTRARCPANPTFDRAHSAGARCLRDRR